jgi:hypothetical protein
VAKNPLELWQDAASEPIEKMSRGFFGHSPGSWCMMQMINDAWKNTIGQIVEEDSTAC